VDEMMHLISEEAKLELLLKVEHLQEQKLQQVVVVVVLVENGIRDMKIVVVALAEAAKLPFSLS
jgi:hypothetical protein